jgi:septation ring formation regulator EzrA
LLALLPLYAFAADSALPAPTSRFVVGPGISGSFDLFRDSIPKYNSRIDVQYWFALVRSCGGDPAAFAEQQFQAWAPSLDPERHALIVICQDEQALGAHTGTAFTYLGMSGPELAAVLSKDSEVMGPLRGVPAETARQSMLKAEGFLVESLRKRASAREAALAQVTKAEADLAAARAAITEAKERTPLPPIAGFGEGESEGRLAEAKNWLEVSPKEAGRIAESLQQQAAKAQEQLKEALAQESALPPRQLALQTQVESLRQKLPITGGEDEALRATISAVEGALKAHDEARARGDYAEAVSHLARGESMLPIGDAAADEGNAIRRLRVVYIPLLLGLAALMAAVIAAIGFRAVARAWRTRAQNELDVYASRLADLLQRLEALRARQALLLEGPDLHARLYGTTLARYESAGEKYDRVTAMIGRAQELLQKARAKAAARGIFSTSSSQGVLRFLQDGSCAIAYGPSVSKETVMLRSSREHHLPTARLLDEIALSLPEAAKEMDELGAQVREARPSAEKSSQAVKAAQDIYQELGQLGVTPASAQVELSSLESATVALETDVSRDPIAVVSQARVIQEAAQAINKRLGTALSLAQRASQDLPTQGRALWVKVYELRQQGYKLREAAFEPEIHKEKLDRALGAAVAALNALDLDRAQSDLAQAEEALGLLRDGIKASIQSKENGPKEEATLRGKIEALQERLTRERPALERLLARGEAARELSENVDRIPGRLSRISQLVVESDRRSAESFYLAAAERRAQAHQQLRGVEELLNEVHERDKLAAMGIETEPSRRPKAGDSSKFALPKPGDANLKAPEVPKIPPGDPALRSARMESVTIPVRVGAPTKPGDSNQRIPIPKASEASKPPSPPTSRIGAIVLPEAPKKAGPPSSSAIKTISAPTPGPSTGSGAVKTPGTPPAQSPTSGSGAIKTVGAPPASSASNSGTNPGTPRPTSPSLPPKPANPAIPAPPSDKEKK